MWNNGAILITISCFPEPALFLQRCLRGALRRWRRGLRRGNPCARSVVRNGVKLLSASFWGQTVISLPRRTIWHSVSLHSLLRMSAACKRTQWFRLRWSGDDNMIEYSTTYRTTYIDCYFLRTGWIYWHSVFSEYICLGSDLYIPTRWNADEVRWNGTLLNLSDTILNLVYLRHDNFTSLW